MRKENNVGRDDLLETLVHQHAQETLNESPLHQDGSKIDLPEYQSLDEYHIEINELSISTVGKTNPGDEKVTPTRLEDVHPPAELTLEIDAEVGHRNALCLHGVQVKDSKVVTEYFVVDEIDITPRDMDGTGLANHNKDNILRDEESTLIQETIEQSIEDNLMDG